MPVVGPEDALRPPLIRWLRARGRIRDSSLVIQELPLHGRRVDLVIVGASGLTTAFELKVGRFGRALEQALYNRPAFHRSYVVVGSVPRDESILIAEQHGVGVIVVSAAGVQVVLESPTVSPETILQRRVQRRASSKAGL